MRHCLLTATCLVALAPSLPASAQHDHAGPPADALMTSQIGTVEFRTTCASGVHDEFNRAVSLLHSFWFAESRVAFERVLKSDPDCAIAYWGLALSWWGNPFAGLRTPATIEAGRAILEQQGDARTRSPREQAYLDAVAILFSDVDPGTQRERVERYEAAMARLAAAYPQDVEARIFWALALAQSARADDMSYARQLQAGALLEPLFARMPQHPGLAHYIIHAYDVPPLAAKALPAARAYADIAPAVPHALHMPSHTFTRVGLWQESVATNQRSAEAAARAGEPAAVLHALDYMIYAYLQMAMDREAKAVLERAAALTSPENEFAVAAIPARYALERQQWQEAAQLPVPGNLALPHTQAVVRFARAVGAARSGNVDAIEPEIDRLAELHEAALRRKDAYWASIIHIQRQAAEAWQRFARGDREQGIAMMRAAALMEDGIDKSAVTPGPLAPAREMLGYMLLESGRAGDALGEFAAVLAKEPNRFLALYGAARAASLAGESTRARDYFQQIVLMCRDAGPQRPELAEARKRARPCTRDSACP